MSETRGGSLVSGEARRFQNATVISFKGSSTSALTDVHVDGFCLITNQSRFAVKEYLSA
jgi:hypothetical protein